MKRTRKEKFELLHRYLELSEVTLAKLGTQLNRHPSTMSQYFTNSKEIPACIAWGLEKAVALINTQNQMAK